MYHFLRKDCDSRGVGALGAPKRGHHVSFSRKKEVKLVLDYIEAECIKLL